MRITAILLSVLCGTTALAGNDELIMTATNFYEALSSNNIADARSLLINPENLDDDGSTSFDIDKYYFSGSSEEGDTAMVETSTVNGKGTLSFNTVLEKRDGEWKINFNKTILNMAGAATKEKQVEGEADLSIDTR